MADEIETNGSVESNWHGHMAIWMDFNWKRKNYLNGIARIACSWTFLVKFKI